MKAEELMIGDWIQTSVGYRQVEQNYRYVIYTSTEKVISGEYCAVQGEEWIENEIEPIPLTPEILEKNGFKKMSGFYRLELWNNYDEWCIEITNIEDCPQFYLNIEHSCDDVYQGGIDDMKIFYVHELQHALRLCGIDKEIVI